MIELNKIAIIAGEHEVTYAEMLQRVAQFSRKTPSGPDTKTVIFSENREGWAYAFYAIWLNEGVAVPVDATSTVGDVAYILDDCKPDAVWVSAGLERTIRAAIEQAGVSTAVNIIDDYESLSLAGEPKTSLLPWSALSEPDNQDTAVIIYTMITNAG